MLSDKIVSTGKFWFKRENKVRMEYEKPSYYLLVINGNNIKTKDSQKENKVSSKSNKVFEQVNDFHKWEAWSPWAKLDPTAKYTFEGPSAGTGAIMKWSGNDAMGEGNITITESQPSDRIKLKLHFIKPYEDTSDTEFAFKAKGDQTVVTWTMTGERGYLAKAICFGMNVGEMFGGKNMEKMVGGSYEEGLKNMKAVAEGKKIESK